MMTTYGNDESLIKNESNNLQPLNKSIQMNNFAYDYLNNVKENRSMYGNYLDNSLSNDPYKEQKSVYNVVNEPYLYDPWG